MAGYFVNKNGQLVPGCQKAGIEKQVVTTCAKTGEACPFASFVCHCLYCSEAAARSAIHLYIGVRCLWGSQPAGDKLNAGVNWNHQTVLVAIQCHKYAWQKFTGM